VLDGRWRDLSEGSFALHAPVRHGSVSVVWHNALEKAGSPRPRSRVAEGGLCRTASRSGARATATCAASAFRRDRPDAHGRASGEERIRRRARPPRHPGAWRRLLQTTACLLCQHRLIALRNTARASRLLRLIFYRETGTACTRSGAWPPSRDAGFRARHVRGLRDGLARPCAHWAPAGLDENLDERILLPARGNACACGA